MGIDAKQKPISQDAARDLLAACQDWINWLEAPGDGHFDGAADYETAVLSRMRRAIKRAESGQ